MRGYIVGLVIVAIIAITILNTYRPDLLEFLDELAALHPVNGGGKVGMRVSS